MSAYTGWAAVDASTSRFRVPDRDHILQVHGVHPEVMRHHYDLYVALMHRRGPLERGQREMIAVTVSPLNRCRY